MRNTNSDSNKRYNGRNGEEFLNELTPVSGDSPFTTLIRTQPIFRGWLQPLMFALGIPSASDLNIVKAPGAKRNNNEETIRISDEDREWLRSNRVPLVEPVSESVIAWQVAFTFGFAMPNFSQESLLFLVGLIGGNSFIANMLVTPILDNNRFPNEKYRTNFNALVISLLLGISVYQRMIESPDLLRAAGVGTMVATNVSFNKYIPRYEAIMGSDRNAKIKACEEIAKTFFLTAAKVFSVVEIFNLISQQLDNDSAQAILAKLAVAMLIIPHLEHIYDSAYKQVSSLWDRPEIRDEQAQEQEKNHAQPKGAHGGPGLA